MPAIGSSQLQGVLRATGIAWAVLLACALLAGVAEAVTWSTGYDPETGLLGRWFGGAVAVAMRGQYLPLGVFLISCTITALDRSERGEPRPLAHRRDRAFIGAALLATIVAQFGAAAWLVGGVLLNGGNAWKAFTGGMTVLGPVFLLAACIGAFLAGILPVPPATVGAEAVEEVPDAIE